MTGPSIGKGQEKKKPFFILLFTEVTFFGFFFFKSRFRLTSLPANEPAIQHVTSNPNLD